MSTSSPSSSEPEMTTATCLFCRIVARSIPARLVSETPTTLAFHDISPAAPTHILVIPKQHFANLGEAVRTDPEVPGLVLAEVARIAAEQGLDKGYRVVINTGRFGGQSVDHLHAHLLGGRPHTWPPG